MGLKIKKTIEEDLQKATSQMAVDIILSHNATQEDIAAGVYEPITKISSILDWEKITLAKKVAKDLKDSNPKTQES